MRHRPPDSDYGAPLHDLTKLYPADVYTHPHYYGDGRRDDREAWSIAASTRGRPSRSTLVFRALPCTGKTLHKGDWVTTVRAYARDHAGSDEGQCVRWTRVKASCLHTDGNSLFEWGYNCEDVPFRGVSYRARKRKS